jgi:hypothetical protein
MRSAMLSVVLGALLTACIGTADSLHQVEGVAPESGICRVAVLEAGTSRVLRAEDVRGNFSVSYWLGGPFSPEVDIMATCNGKSVRQLKGIAPRMTGVTSLGTLAP